MNYISKYFGSLYERFRRLEFHEGIFIIVKLQILKFECANPKSSKVKTYDYVAINKK